MRRRDVHGRGRGDCLYGVCCERGLGRAQGRMPVQCRGDRERERVRAVWRGEVQGRDWERELC